MTATWPAISPHCWLAQHGVMEHGDAMPPCEGQLIHAHLIDQQELRRRGLSLLAGDQRTWVLACGGISGIGGHHGMFDFSKKLRVPFDVLPPEVFEFAAEHGLTPWLERKYRR